MSGEAWDLVVVGAGPAGAAAALARCTPIPRCGCCCSTAPTSRATSPAATASRRTCSTPCAAVGVARRRATAGRRCAGSSSPTASTASPADCARPVLVIPRAVFDARLVERAVAAGAVLRRHRVATLRREGDQVVIDGSRHAAGASSAPTAPTRRSAPRSLGRAARPPRPRDPRLRADRRRAARPAGDPLRRPPPAVVRLGLRPRRRPVQRRVRRAARPGDRRRRHRRRALLLDQLDRLAARARRRRRPTGAATTCRSRAGAGTSPTDRCCWPATPPAWSTR